MDIGDQSVYEYFFLWNWLIFSCVRLYFSGLYPGIPPGAGQLNPNALSNFMNPQYAAAAAQLQQAQQAAHMQRQIGTSHLAMANGASRGPPNLFPSVTSATSTADMMQPPTGVSRAPSHRNAQLQVKITMRT